MDRKIFDQTLGQAIPCSILFAIIVFGITQFPQNDSIWGFLKVILVIFLFILNLVMLIGFTSFQSDNTKVFYAGLIPIYPIYLITEELNLRWEWWDYVALIFLYGVCFSILSYCLFANRMILRSIESIAIVLYVFSSPYLYSEIF